jgi:hypothetical protein
MQRVPLYAMDALSQKQMIEYAKGNGWLPSRAAVGLCTLNQVDP